MLLPRQHLMIISFHFPLPKMTSNGWTDTRTNILMSFMNCPWLSLGPCQISSSSKYRKWRFSSFENNTGHTDGPTDGHDLFQRCVVASKNQVRLFTLVSCIRSFLKGGWSHWRVSDSGCVFVIWFKMLLEHVVEWNLKSKTMRAVHWPTNQPSDIKWKGRLIATLNHLRRGNRCEWYFLPNPSHCS